MSGWDSSWETTLKVKVDGRPVALQYRAIYDTPSYVALEVTIPEQELGRLGYAEPNGDVVLDSAYRESSRIDARSMEDSDVYDLLGGRLKKLDRLTARGSQGLTRAALERLMSKQGLDVTRRVSTPGKAAARRPGHGNSGRRTSPVTLVVRRSDGLYLKPGGMWSSDKKTARRFKDTAKASFAAYNACPFGKSYEFDVIEDGGAS